MTDDMSMWDDPQESSALRQLLRAGQVENSDYDVERGLARHLAQLQGGAPLPAWAARTTLQKTASWSILAWLLPPVISAGVVGAWLAFRPADPPLASLVVAAPQAAAEPVTESARGVARAQPELGIAQEPTGNGGLANANVAAESSANQDRDVRDGVDYHDRHEHHNAVMRPARQPVRATNVRRGRAGRADDVAPAYAAVAQSTREGGVGAGAGLAATNATNKGATESASSLSTKPNANAKVEAAAQEPVPASPEDAKAKSRAHADKEVASGAKVDEVSGTRLEREMRMLAVAQRVLSEDPARSLRLCRQGESEFRGSMFSAERKQVALLALVQLGKVDQARREGIPFLRAFPNAPWSARLREALSSGHLPKP